MLDDAEITRILSITAHPDDVDFAAAGTVARWTEAGIVFFLYCRYVRPGAPFFKKQTLTRATPTLVPDE